VAEDDILEFDLDSNPIDQHGRAIFAERWIHGSVYKVRPEVNAVCHNHASQLIPFAATATPIRPIWVMGAAISEEVSIWDIREDSPTKLDCLSSAPLMRLRWPDGFAAADAAYSPPMAR
jgi:HCOMODA/2-hydroxy-3-carboxy-muconic semialdehyde decarboxylase